MGCSRPWSKRPPDGSRPSACTRPEKVRIRWSWTFFASSGVEAEIVQEAEVLEVLPGLHVPVARAGHLLALKALSVSPKRPQDLADILALLREATPEDVDQARKTATLIVQRGYGRGRNLLGDLEAHLASHG